MKGRKRKRKRKRECMRKNDNPHIILLGPKFLKIGLPCVAQAGLLKNVLLLLSSAVITGMHSCTGYEFLDLPSCSLLLDGLDYLSQLVI